MALVGDEGKTIRFPATALLTIDSEDRFKTQLAKRDIDSGGSSPYDFTISPGNGGRSILGGFVRRMGVSEVQFPWCVPNINRQTSSITVAWNGATTSGSATVNITQGFYTPFELAAAFQAAVRALSVDLAAFTLVYSNIFNFPNFYYFTNNATTIIFAPVPPSNILNITEQSRQLFDLLGFTSQQYTPATSGNGLYTFCQFTRYIDIECAQLTQFQGLFDGTTQAEYRDALCRLYLGDNTTMSNLKPSDPDYSPPGCRPFIIYRQFQNMKQINFNARSNIGSFLQFRVFNDNGQLLSLNTPFPGTSSYEDWNMTILASEN